MFKIIFLIIFLGLMYVLLRNERNSIKFTFLIYFSLLSIVFIIGLNYISSTYQLSHDPIDGGFDKKFDWVYVFLYLYFIPLFILLGYKLFKFTNKVFESIWAKIMMSILWLVLLAGIGFVLPFIFILMFYGFAP
ncbi:hypothetical protein FHR85_001356 [Alkalibacillus almallahensis]|nr:hypothetical protein [Alkalibacillus almallahensis]